jgi:ubiquinone/menaquinone biosynthesis C-methylase UbiE
MARDFAQEKITAFWSMVAPYYEAHEGNVPTRDSAEHAAWIEAMRGLLPAPPADVLDVGTGTGYLATIAAALGHRVTGIDLSDAMLAEARENARKLGLDMRFERRDAVSTGLAASSFDVVMCRHFLWTLRDPDAALRGWRELVRSGGRVVAIDGQWFTEPLPPAGEEGDNVFAQHYSEDTRSRLPLMMALDPAPVAATFERAGWIDVEVSHLDTVYALADKPPGPTAWYVVVAHPP